MRTIMAIILFLAASMCPNDCQNEYGICVSYCHGNGNCIARCDDAFQRCVSRCYYENS